MPICYTKRLYQVTIWMYRALDTGFSRRNTVILVSLRDQCQSTVLNPVDDLA